MINKVVISGRLVSDPELKSTSQGTSVCSFSIANDVGYGQAKHTYFINCTTWDSRAENLVRYCRKGSLIILEGQLITRSWEDKNKLKRTVTEINVQEIQYLDSKKQEETNQNQTIESAPMQDIDDDDLPF